MSRVTQGVKLINLKDGQKVSSISIVDTEKDEVITEVDDTSNSLDENNNISDNEKSEEKTSE